MLQGTEPQRGGEGAWREIGAVPSRLWKEYEQVKNEVKCVRVLVSRRAEAQWRLVACGVGDCAVCVQSARSQATATIKGQKVLLYEMGVTGLDVYEAGGEGVYARRWHPHVQTYPRCNL